jgi:hypothetical protein
MDFANEWFDIRQHSVFFSTFQLRISIGLQKLKKIRYVALYQTIRLQNP